MQAQDIVLRRLLDDRSGYDAFIAAAEMADEPRLRVCIEVLKTAADKIAESPDCAEAAASAMLRLCANAALAWIGAGYVQAEPQDAVLTVAAEHWLDGAEARARFELEQITSSQKVADRYSTIRHALR